MTFFRYVGCSPTIDFLIHCTAERWLQNILFSLSIVVNEEDLNACQKCSMLKDSIKCKHPFAVSFVKEISLSTTCGFLTHQCFRLLINTHRFLLQRTSVAWKIQELTKFVQLYW